jgi:hypothetical protein
VGAAPLAAVVAPARAAAVAIVAALAGGQRAIFCTRPPTPAALAAAVSSQVQQCPAVPCPDPAPHSTPSATADETLCPW